MSIGIYFFNFIVDNMACNLKEVFWKFYIMVWENSLLKTISVFFFIMQFKVSSIVAIHWHFHKRNRNLLLWQCPHYLYFFGVNCEPEWCFQLISYFSRSKYCNSILSSWDLKIISLRLSSFYAFKYDQKRFILFDCLQEKATLFIKSWINI